MFKYSYIVNATLARLDIDEAEAQDMHLLNRFSYYANEAMQAICASRPRYDYINVTVVKHMDDVVYDTESSIFRIATADDYTIDPDTGERLYNQGVTVVSDEKKREFYHNQNIYETGEKYKCGSDFIAFAPNKQAFIRTKLSTETLNTLPTGTILYDKCSKEYDRYAKINYDYSIVNGNEIKFYHEGEYYIPARFIWYQFKEYTENDDPEIDIPYDILMTIPIYIASICLQIDNIQRAQLMRQEFELALSRCISTDRMMQSSLPQTW